MPDPQTPIAAARAHLERSLGALYAAFAGYTAPSVIVAAPFRDADEILADLRSAPLQTLPAQALAPYAFWAVTTVGTDADYRHFLPRILELATCNVSDPGFELCIIASRLIFAGWDSWPQAEREAVAGFMHAAFAHDRLQDIEVRVAAWEWIRAMAMLGVPVMPCLKLWLDRPTADTMLQLAQGEREIKPLLRANGYWKEVSPATRQALLDWLAGDAVETGLVDTIDMVPERHRWQVETMLDAIGDIRRSGMIEGERG